MKHELSDLNRIEHILEAIYELELFLNIINLEVFGLKNNIQSILHELEKK